MSTDPFNDKPEEKPLQMPDQTMVDREPENEEPPAARSGGFLEFLSLFIPREPHVVTSVLAIVNILIFILMIASGVHFMTPEGQSLIQWGANFRPETLDGGWWRLISCCFLHIGVLHLLLNMYALLYIGVLLEPILGKWRFLAVYLLTGVAASTASLWWNDMTISAGASGAIFGMYGVFLALLTGRFLDKSMRQAFLASILIFVVYNIFYGLKTGSGIDNAAHIGGLVSGLVMGFAMIPVLKRPAQTGLNYLTLSALAFATWFSAGMVIKNVPKDMLEYQKRLDTFVYYESRALEVFNLPADSPPDAIAAYVQDSGIFYWDKSIELIRTFDALRLPGEVRERNTRLERYCELRKRNYQLVIMSLREGNNQYEEEIAENNRKIELLIASLAGK